MIQHRTSKTSGHQRGRTKNHLAQNKIHLNHCTNDVAAGSSKIMEKMKAVSSTTCWHGFKGYPGMQVILQSHLQVQLL
jgi:hypothetical protein